MEPLILDDDGRFLPTAVESSRHHEGLMLTAATDRTDTVSAGFERAMQRQLYPIRDGQDEPSTDLLQGVGNRLTAYVAFRLSARSNPQVLDLTPSRQSWCMAHSYFPKQATA